MAILTGSLQRSLSRLELAVASIIIFILAALFIRQVWVLSARAEQRFLEVSVINFNTALHQHAALLYLKGQQQELSAMDGMNPFNLMQSAGEANLALQAGQDSETLKGPQYRVLPSRYQGEFAVLGADSIRPGNWYFDRSHGELVYSVSNDEYFETDDSALPLIRFRVTLEYDDENSNRRFDAGVDRFRGVKLKNLGGFRWEI